MEQNRWNEIQTAFDELADQDSAHRARGLAAIGERDPELRAVLESLLSADVAADLRLRGVDSAFMVHSTSGPANGTRSGAVTDPFGLSGRIVSHFRVLDAIGAGGMGVVYRALDTRLGRAVALKFMLPQRTFESSARQRFLREARSAAALDHPNLCAVHEVGESEDGLPFLAMPLYVGETLQVRLAREHCLELRDALEIARQVAAGLAHAHGAGIVHRDLKPANVMLMPDGAVKVLDFGLARARDQTLTATGEIVGTVAYMAPEQISGNGVDARADLWALGVMLYEMITGRRPFKGEHDVSVGHAILHEEPPRPSTLHAETPSTVEALILGLLEKNPSRRPADALWVHTRLSAVEQELVRVPRAARKFVRWRINATSLRNSRLSRIVVAIGIGVLILTGAAALMSRLRRPSAASDVPIQRSIAVLPFENLNVAEEDKFLAGGLHDVVISELTKVADVRVVNTPFDVGYTTSRPLRQIAKELDVGKILQARVQRLADRVRVTPQLYDGITDKIVWAEPYERRSQDLFALESDVALAIVNALHAELTTVERARLRQAPTRNAQAYELYLQGRDYQQRSLGLSEVIFAPGESNVRSAEKLYRRAVELDSGFALARARLAQIHLEMLRYDRTRERLEQARVQAVAALRLEPRLPEAHFAMGSYWLAVGDEERGLAELLIASRDLPADGQLHSTIASIRRRRGHWNEALAELEIARRLDPRQPTIPVQLAFTYQAMGRFADAARTWDTAIELAPDNYRYLLEKARVFLHWQANTDSMESVLRRVPADFDPAGQTTLARVDLARFRRRYADALAAFEQMQPAAFNDSDGAFLHINRAHIYEWLGHPARARVDYVAARANLEKAVSENADNSLAHAILGLVYAGLGQKPAALFEARRGLELMPISKDAFLGPLVMYFGALTYERAGETDAAVDLLERIHAIPSYVGPSIAELRVDPYWDPLRRNPRFQRLIAGN